MDSESNGRWHSGWEERESGSGKEVFEGWMKGVGERIRHFRMNRRPRGLTLKEAAERVCEVTGSKMGGQYFKRIESGQINLPLIKLLALIDALGCDPVDVFDLGDELRMLREDNFALAAFIKEKGLGEDLEMDVETVFAGDELETRVKRISLKAREALNHVEKEKEQQIWQVLSDFAGLSLTRINTEVDRNWKDILKAKRLIGTHLTNDEKEQLTKLILTQIRQILSPLVEQAVVSLKAVSIGYSGPDPRKMAELADSLKRAHDEIDKATQYVQSI